MYKLRCLSQLCGAVLIAISLCFNSTSAQALSIKIGEVEIKDYYKKDKKNVNEGYDLDERSGYISFKSVDFKGNDQLKDFLVAGIVTSKGGLNTIVSPGGGSGVTLTNFILSRKEQGQATVNIVFEETYPNEQEVSIFAADGIKGNFADVTGNIPGKGVSVEWQGYVNKKPISPPNGVFKSGPNPTTGEFSGGHGRQVFKDKSFLLEGDLKVTLSNKVDIISLPNSAEIGMSTSSIQPPPTDRTPVCLEEQTIDTTNISPNPCVDEPNRAPTPGNEVSPDEDQVSPGF
jgi:hypothetical protein